METDEDIELGGVSAASSSPSKSFGLRRRRGGFQLTAEGPTSSPTLNMGNHPLFRDTVNIFIFRYKHS